MSIRDWVGATWAEWCPTLDPGRLEIGPFIFMTRSALRDSFTLGIELGRQWEAEGIDSVGSVKPRASLHSV